jgi:MYXO-CTERM domain-containing protein
MSVASSSLLGGGSFRAARALVAVGVFFAPLDAHALSCALAGVTAPFLRTADVPTNTRIWCTEERQWPIGSIVLRDAQGSVVSGTQTALFLPDVTVVVFRPDVELDPVSRYTYHCPLLDVSEYTFTTGEGPRVGAPPVPNSSPWAAQAFRRDDLGDNYLVSFDNAEEPDSIVVFDIGGAASMDAEGPSGVLSDVTDALYSAGVFVGRGSCAYNWPEATLGASTTVALGAFDVTGAFSGWSDTVTVTLPTTLEDRSTGSNSAERAGTPRSESSPDGALSGCSLASVPDGSRMAVGALAAVAGLAAARRRRRRHPARKAARGSSC